MEETNYTDTLTILGKIADGYCLSGAEHLNIPCLKQYIRFVRSLEKFFLLCWQDEFSQDKSHANPDHVRQVRVKYEIRHKKGVIRNYQAFRREIREQTHDKPGFHDEVWKSYIFLVLSNTSLFTEQVKPPRSFNYILSLLFPHPTELIGKFLSISEDTEFADVDLNFKCLSIKNSYTEVFLKYLENMDPEKLWTELNKLKKINTGGELLRYKAFEPFWSGENQKQLGLKGIRHDKIQSVKPLYGIDDNYQQLKENLNLFIQGRPYRHVLLWGYRGTGKSTCVIKLANEYFEKGIRLIEYPASKIGQIHLCFDLLENYREKFIVFLDDLSFEKDDTSYKMLKSNLEGSIKRRAANIVLHTTSNRRELADPGQSFNDERSDYPQLLDEKRAIDDRFGLKLFFDLPAFEDLKILLGKIAEEYAVSIDNEELYIQFRKFCMFNRLTSPGGRAIRQFIEQLIPADVKQ